MKKNDVMNFLSNRNKQSGSLRFDNEYKEYENKFEEFNIRKRMLNMCLSLL